MTTRVALCLALIASMVLSFGKTYHAVTCQAALEVIMDREG